MTRPFRLGLTGSIGMGKSTTARFFADAGVPVWDADAAVHRLYAPSGAAFAPLKKLCPQAAGPDGIDRAALKAWIAADPDALAQIERVVHPLVTRDRADFIARSQSDILVFDIPLLFETGAETQMDAVAVVSAPPDLQRARVLARPGMSAAQFDLVLSKQLPDAEKRARADFIIESIDLDSARTEVHEILRRIRERMAHA